MSVAVFGKHSLDESDPSQPNPNVVPKKQTVQQMLDENAYLIKTIAQLQKDGNIKEVVKYQDILHRNLLDLF